MNDQDRHLTASDPTPLTTQQILREVGMLREVIEAQIEGIKVRLAGMDKAIEVAARYPTAIDGAVSQQDKLFAEKLVAVRAEVQASKDVSDERSRCNKEAITKSEYATAKQIDAIEKLAGTSAAALGAKIDDIKERVNNSEGRAKGAGESWGVVASIIALLAAVAAVVVTLVR